VRIRTRIHVSPAEAAALGAIGAFLGSVYRGELAERIERGVLDRDGHAAWRAERKQAVSGVSSSRWAGAITRAVEDQYQLGMRGLATHAADLRAAVGVLQARCALHPGQLAPTEAVDTGRQPRSRRPRGYRNRAERFAKTRRLAVLRSRLNTAEEALAAGRPSMVVGGKRLWRTRNHLDAANMIAQQWRDRWDAARMFLTADGETGKPGGNETIRVDDAGHLRIKTPVALAAELGTHLTIAVPVALHHRGDEWAARVAGRRAVRYDISYDPERDRWYLDASWTTTVEPPASLEELRAWPAAFSTARATRLVNPSASRYTPAGWRRRGAMGGCAQRSPPCSTTQSFDSATRSWWRTWISPTPAPLGVKPWAAVRAGNDCAAPSPVSPPAGSVPGSPVWRHGAASR
jgi:hypothetical protein